MTRSPVSNGSMPPISTTSTPFAARSAKRSARSSCRAGALVTTGDGFTMTVTGTVFAERRLAGRALNQARSEALC